MACSQGTSAIMTLGGMIRPRAALCSYETIKRGRRAAEQGWHKHDRQRHLHTMNTPIEVLEMAFPLRVAAAIDPDRAGRALSWRLWRAPRLALIENADATGALCMGQSSPPSD